MEYEVLRYEWHLLTDKQLITGAVITISIVLAIKLTAKLLIILRKAEKATKARINELETKNKPTEIDLLALIKGLFKHK